MSDIHGRWTGLVGGKAATGAALAPEAFIQQVLQESVLQLNEELKYLADKVRHFNALKEAMREYVQDLREFDERRKSGQPSHSSILQPEVEKLRQDLLHLHNSMRDRRIVERGQALATAQKTEQVYKALLRRPFKP